MKQARISVAMATYNGERFLQEQLDSLARQTLLPCELVACDDGSTDGTLDILHRFAAEAPFPVRIYQNETRLGYGPNFLWAASLCSGDLIAFCDQDDVWLDSKLQRCAEVIYETDCVLLIHSARVVDENLVLLRCTTSARRLTCLDSGKGQGWNTLARGLGMTRGCMCVFQSKLLRQVPPGFPVAGPNIGHESWLAFAAEASGKATLLPDNLLLYRQHGGNVVGFRARPSGGLRSVLETSGAEYLQQAKDASARASLLADAAERLPELRPRLRRAQEWYEARAQSFSNRASLYPGNSSSSAAHELFSLISNGTYRPISRGGLGLRALAKDSIVPFLPSRRGLRSVGQEGDRALDRSVSSAAKGEG